MVVQGLSWPEDKGEWVPLMAGRPLRQAHYEMIADRSLGLPLGEKLKLGKDVYEVVGLTQGHGGDGRRRLVFFHGERREAIQFDVPGEAMRLERAARRAPAGKPGPWPGARRCYRSGSVGPASGIARAGAAASERGLGHAADGADASAGGGDACDMAGRDGLFHAATEGPAALGHGGQGAGGNSACSARCSSSFPPSSWR